MAFDPTRFRQNFPFIPEGFEPVGASFFLGLQDRFDKFGRALQPVLDAMRRTNEEAIERLLRTIPVQVPLPVLPITEPVRRDPRRYRYYCESENE